MNKIKPLLPYFLIHFILFYGSPLFIKDTGSGMLMLLLIIPISCFILGFLVAKKRLSIVIYPIFSILILIPAIYLFYNETAMIYSIYYFIAIVLGILLGSILRSDQRS